jgi:hypothetical protein
MRYILSRLLRLSSIKASARLRTSSAMRSTGSCVVCPEGSFGFSAIAGSPDQRRFGRSGASSIAKRDAQVAVNKLVLGEKRLMPALALLQNPAPVIFNKEIRKDSGG